MEALSTAADWAGYYHEMGWVLVPGRADEKRPLWKWKEYQTRRLTDLELHKLAREVQAGACLCLVTGTLSRVVVLDCDSAEAEEMWRERLGEPMWDAAWKVRTKRGVHIYAQVLEGQSVQRGSSGEDWDFRAEGGIVVVPPLEGRNWEKGPWEGPGLAADDLLAVVKAGKGSRRPTGSHGRNSEDEGRREPVSTFSALLKAPPVGEGSGRNNWLAAVSGHLAVWIPFRDAFEANVRLIGQSLKPPLPDREIDKMLVSVWDSEKAKTEEVREVPEGLSEDAGWAWGLDGRIWVRVKKGRGEEAEFVLAPWTDFDLRALNVTEDESGERFYDCELRRARDGQVLRVLLSHRDLTDGRRLSTWLGGWGVTTADPVGCDKMRETVRLQRYLESQEPQHLQVSSWLGDQGGLEGDFLTWDGAIGPKGERKAWQGVAPNPAIRSHARLIYGFEADEQAAIEVLREVLGFQDERVAGLFGAWWMACLLKGRVMPQISQFPVMLVEAASESGKTTGFFRMMHELAGGAGPIVPTRATFRDALAASRNTPVWVDDANDLEQYEEMIRATTTEGVYSKMAEDRRTGLEFRLRAPLLITGEVGLDTSQKALADRSIRLEVPPGVSRRKSQRKGREGRPQWDDVIELRERWGSLQKLAGWLVAKARQYPSQERVEECKPRGGDLGRFGDKLALLYWGAHALDWMLGNDQEDETSITAQVQIWEPQQGYHSDDNVLTTRILPELLARTGWKSEPEIGERNFPPTPVWVREYDDRVMFSPKLCAGWWAEIHRGRVDKRTETAEALEQQAKALGVGGARGVNRVQTKLRDALGRVTNKKQMYWVASEELSEMLLDRSKGI